MIEPTGEEHLESASADINEIKRRATTGASDAWEQAKEKAGVARERTELFVRANPVPTLIGALGVGIAIGLAIRYASSSSEPEVKAKESAMDAAWSFLSLPFLWPLLKSARARAEDSADAMKDGVDRLRKVDVSQYTKPLRKRWNSWTR